jgi:D-glycero-D-manno-heptose 1,7-bisphosphate phosphatase
MIAPARRPSVFIDRDGVINEERAYVHKIADFEILPGVFDGLALLQQAGYQLVVVTNQAGIGRGYYSEAEFQALTRHMHSLMKERSIAIAATYHCPHHPTAALGGYRRECDCRKPSPGMLLQAANDLSLDLGASVLIGDKRSDIEAGRAAGVPRCVLVESGHRLEPGDRAAADIVCADLLAASRWIVASGAVGSLGGPAAQGSFDAEKGR